MPGKLVDLINGQVKFIPVEAPDISDFNVRWRDITANLDELDMSLD